MNQVILKKEDENNKKEEFIVTNNSAVWQVYSLVHFVAFLFALYLSFKCNKGFHFLSFLAAFCCPWIYIIYILATRKGFCSDKTLDIDLD
ncbi:hypothetical protein QJ856_gp1263 [Tupanvirus deep ocean]|uniref:Uncharacterized protein n=2 Tax=Tupanvirus TaxID=2094720 RepID=A0AC62A6X4_9VIRU|nr:hypothetical protein QJ856_gp1263 [Tupanvirus deep ocean]QKU33502.1 hypothetical protein [Tupanvirus deep ocean]